MNAIDQLARLAARPVRLDLEGGACPKCKAPLDDGAKFCVECGDTVATNECAKCGEELPEGAKFCRKCGEKKAPPTPANGVSSGNTAPGGDGISGGVMQAADRVAAGGGFWSAKEVEMMVSGIDLLLIQGDQDPTDDHDLEMLKREVPPWLNKKFPMQGQDAADYRAYYAMGMAFGPRLLAMIVTWYRSSGKKEREQEKKPEEKKDGDK